ncbi:MAG: hypothetical protein ABI612_25220, partial [Betaproteobacteria bacterium]
DLARSYCSSTSKSVASCPKATTRSHKSEIERMRAMIAEITAENRELKKDWRLENLTRVPAQAKAVMQHRRRQSITPAYLTDRHSRLICFAQDLYFLFSRKSSMFAFANELRLLQGVVAADRSLSFSR